jgi:hypothetical protein
MIQSTRIGLLIGLAVVILVGTGAVALGQTGNVQQDYDAKLKSLDHKNPEAVYQFARWCFLKGLKSDAMTYAVEANEKAPNDVRAKYLIYALTRSSAAAAGQGEEAVEETGGKPAESSITDKEVKAIYDGEGPIAMDGFKRLQRVLIERCGKLECHGGSLHPKWVLIRHNIDAPQTIAENFRNVTKYVLRKPDQAKSPVLVLPAKGSEKHPVAFFGARDTVYQQLLKWIETLKTDSEKLFEDAKKTPPPPTTK